MSKKTKKTFGKKLKVMQLGQNLMASKQRSNIKQENIPSMSQFLAKIKNKTQRPTKKVFPMPYEQVQRAKSGKVMEKVKNPSVAYKVADKIIKSKKYPYVNRAVNPKSPTIDNQTMRTMGSDGKLFPTIRRNKRGRLRQYGSKQAMKIAQLKNDAISVTDIAPTYVDTKDVSIALSNRVGKARGVPPKKGPNPQGMKEGGCPYRENGVRRTINGVKPIQIKGVKFTGVK